MILEPVCVGRYEVNCYVLAEDEGKEAMIIDPGDDPEKIKKILNKHRLKPGVVINTHGHVDHIGADEVFGVPVYIHKDDLSFLDDPHLNMSQLLGTPLRITPKNHVLLDGGEIRLGKIRLKVLHTPGHTPGGICLLLKQPKGDILFSGDTLFYRGLGRTDLPRASSEQIRKSIEEKLFVLDNRTRVYPGHGPSTTIGEEKRNWDA